MVLFAVAVIFTFFSVSFAAPALDRVPPFQPENFYNGPSEGADNDDVCGEITIIVTMTGTQLATAAAESQGWGGVSARQSSTLSISLSGPSSSAVSLANSEAFSAVSGSATSATSLMPASWTSASSSTPTSQSSATAFSSSSSSSKTTATSLASIDTSLKASSTAAASLPTSYSALPSITLSSSSSTTSSSAAPSASGKYPFSQVVAFGDNLSDNGNGVPFTSNTFDTSANILCLGSYAHCVADPTNCGNKIYGFGTWTDGPIAVSYLVTELGVPLTTDYAFGHANGGSLFGATIDNAYTQSTANAPSAKDQIATYTTSNPTDIADALHFLWIGANDINLYHINVDSTDNSQFATDMSTRMASLVETLITAGAPYVFVPNLYPKHVSPSSVFYADTPTRVGNLGSAIAQANDAIEAALAQFGDKAIYYDAYSFMLNVWNNHASFGITHVGGEFCDGYSQQDWDLCVTDGQGDTFYWMQYLDMTSHVHGLLAADMYQTLASHFGV